MELLSSPFCFFLCYGSLHSIGILTEDFMTVGEPQDWINYLYHCNYFSLSNVVDSIWTFCHYPCGLAQSQLLFVQEVCCFTSHCLQETIAKTLLTIWKAMISVISFWVRGIAHLFWPFSSCCNFQDHICFQKAIE